MSKRRRFDVLVCSIGCRLARPPRRQKPCLDSVRRWSGRCEKGAPHALADTTVCNGVHRLYDVIAAELSLKRVHRYFIT
jgi:hypothetical protein